MFILGFKLYKYFTKSDLVWHYIVHNFKAKDLKMHSKSNLVFPFSNA